MSTAPARHRSDAPPASRRARRAVTAGGVVLGVAVLAASIWSATLGAFSADVGTRDDSFASGTVSVTDDGTGTALVSLTAARPGSTRTQCIDVTYDGSLTAADLRLYASGYQSPTALADPDGLAPHVTLDIERRPGASAADCSDFADGSGTAVFLDDASVLGADHASWATGVGSFTPVVGGTYAYRITTTVRDEPGGQGQTMTIGLVWEARR